MSEPTPDTVQDWMLKIFFYAVTGAGSGIAAAMGWFRAHRVVMEAKMSTEQSRVNDEFKAVRHDMAAYYELQSVHDKDIVVLQTKQDNTAIRLQEIIETTRDTNGKVDDLSNKLTDVLLEMKRGHR